MSNAAGLYLQALDMDESTEYLSPSEMVGVWAQYLSIGGWENFTGINRGANTPAVDDQDKPWLEETAGGSAVAWRTWNGTLWEAFPDLIARGGTGDRPVSPVDGQHFRDTDIGANLIWENGKWITSDGVRGDIKEVDVPTIEEALTRNPGWSFHSKSANMVVANVGGTHSLGDTDGSEELSIGRENLPAVKIDIESLVLEMGTTGSAVGNYIQCTPNQTSTPLSSDSNVSSGNTKALGDGTVMSNTQPTIWLWRLVKD